MKKHERKLTVGYKFQNRAYSQMVQMPEIKLTGKWLKQSGFEEGQQVKVIVRDKKLVIVPFDQDNRQPQSPQSEITR